MKNTLTVLFANLIVILLGGLAFFFVTHGVMWSLWPARINSVAPVSIILTCVAVMIECVLWTYRSQKELEKN